MRHMWKLATCMLSMLVVTMLGGCGALPDGDGEEPLGTQHEALTTISPFRSSSTIAAPVSISGARIRTLLVRGSRVYLGGSFTFTFNGQTYSNLAAFDIPSAYLAVPTVVAGFRPQVDGEVRALATDGTRLYAGGSFSTIGGLTRTRLGAVNVDTGAVDSTFTANTSGGLNRVYALAVEPTGTYLIVGGDFTSIKGTSRTNIAAVSKGVGTVSGGFFATGATGGAVRAIKAMPTHSVMVIGGAFTNYQNHANLVVTTSSGAANTGVFSTNAEPVLALDVDPTGDGQVIAGLGGNGNNVIGYRATAGGQGSVIWQTPRVQGDVQAVHYVSGGVYFGFHDGLFVNGNPTGTIGDPYKVAGVTATGTGTVPFFFGNFAPGGPCNATDSRGCWGPKMDPAGGTDGFYGVWAFTSCTPPGGSTRLIIGGEFNVAGTAAPTSRFVSIGLVP